jgi:AhpD family alkylhydroperoxidase
MPAPVINLIERSRLPPDMQSAWDAMMQVSGETTSIEAMANSQAASRWYLEDFYGKLFNGAAPGLRLDQRTKELLRLRLSKGHGCHVCNSGNEIAARQHGFSEAQIQGTLHPSPDLFDERDRAVIDLAAQIDLSNMQGLLTSDLYARLRRYYADAEIVEMGMIAAFLTGMAKFLFVFDLVTREAGCPIVRPAGERQAGVPATSARPTTPGTFA